MRVLNILERKLFDKKYNWRSLYNVPFGKMTQQGNSENSFHDEASFLVHYRCHPPGLRPWYGRNFIRINALCVTMLRQKTSFWERCVVGWGKALRDSMRSHILHYYGKSSLLATDFVRHGACTQWDSFEKRSHHFCLLQYSLILHVRRKCVVRRDVH